MPKMLLVMNEQQRIQQRYEVRDASSTLSGFWTLRNPVVLHLAQERERVALQAMQHVGLDLSEAQVLDVGCGAGGEFALYLRWGARLANLMGVDLMLPRLQMAQRMWGSRVAAASGAHLPFADASFDVVAQNVVFSSMVDTSLRLDVAREMLRVLRPGGYVLWYDAERSRNRDQHFRDVPMDELHALFPGVQWHKTRLTTHLGLLRRCHTFFGRPGICLLEMTGLFKTHMFALGRKT
jgi:ubiquinone/menaquinone biosynthesis C-methylase UbiE